VYRREAPCATACPAATCLLEPTPHAQAAPERVCVLCHAICVDGAGASHVCVHVYADDQGAAQKVQQTQAAVSQLQQANMQQLQQWHTEAVGYVQDLESIHEVLQQLVGHCMVEEQPKIAQVSGHALSTEGGGRVLRCSSLLHRRVATHSGTREGQVLGCSGAPAQGRDSC
jgi:hypothetical protein